MNIPNNLKYTKEHEWIKIDGNYATIGITDFAQSELGDIVFIEFLKKNEKCEIGDTIATIEAVKTVADLYAPLAGTVYEFNLNLEDAPESVNSDPYNNGWIAKIKLDEKFDSSDLLSSKDYEDLIK